MEGFLLSEAEEAGGFGEGDGGEGGASGVSIFIEEGEDFILITKNRNSLWSIGKRNDGRGISSSAVVEFGDADIAIDEKERVFVVLRPLYGGNFFRESSDIEAIALFSHWLNFPLSSEDREYLPIGPVEELLPIIRELCAARFSRETGKPFF